MLRRFAALMLPLALVASAPAPMPSAPGETAEYEWMASLACSFTDPGPGGRELTLAFQLVNADAPAWSVWRLELVDPRGQVLRRWHGETLLEGGLGGLKLPWDGRDHAGALVARGFYTFRLTARALSLADERILPKGDSALRFTHACLDPLGLEAEQSADLCVGPTPVLKLAPFAPLPVHGSRKAGAVRPVSGPAAGALPYTIYYGNLHSHTNHSDGGAPAASCGGSESAQGGELGPTDAYTMMDAQAGGDFLLCSEHNHMYDHSTGTSSTTSATDARYGNPLFMSGKGMASAYSTDHPGFLGLYGLEWGTLASGCGHLNIINPDKLAGWESNGTGNFYEVYTPYSSGSSASSYSGLYTTMKGRNWLGQFNHPSTSHFAGCAYTADGDEAMVLCEIANTRAFSTVTNGTGSDFSFYDSTFKKLLEAGFHVAPSSDQDNHCGTWGLVYPNRTGVLIPSGTALSESAFMDALRARRVFATMDGGSQILLSADNDTILMGDRASHSGPLNLQVRWASTTPGRAASSIQIVEGVPGRKGTPTVLCSGVDAYTTTPSTGQHYYYAMVTQDNGDKLWSAPIWVNQQVSAVSAAITAPAANLTVATGTSVDFAGTGTSSNGAITGYAWTFGDGGTASGGTASHTFTNAGLSPVTSTVTFTVTDALGSTATASRLVTVQPAAGANTAPTVGDITDKSTSRNVPLQVPFTVGDAETAVGLLTVSASSNDQALLPDANLVLGGVGASRTLSLTPAADQTGSAIITVTVTDEGGLTAVDTFAVTVNAEGGGGQGQIIISQYYEGASNDKYIEITNVGGAPVDLASPQLYLALFSNAAADAPSGVSPTASQTLTGTLAPGASLVYKNGSAANPAYAKDLATASGACNFNGDDLVILTTGTSSLAWVNRLDVAGSGSTWGADCSFIRKPGVVVPNPNWVDPVSGESAEWTKVTMETVANAATGVTERLGFHAFDAAPTISAIASQSTGVNTPLGPIAFTVSGAGTLTVTASSTDGTIVAPEGLQIDGTGKDRSLTVTPVPDASGTTVITLSAADASSRVAQSSFQLTVVAGQGTVTGVSVQPANVTVNAGATRSFTATVQGTGGFVNQAVVWSAQRGAITAQGLYTAPATGGPDTVSATSVADGNVVGTASVLVNTAPTAVAQDLSTAVDTPLAITLGGSDPEGGTLSCTVLTQPQHGTLSGTAPSLTYTPTAGYSGPDSFTFKVSDGLLDSSAATVQIAVRPVAPDRSLGILPGRALSGTLTATGGGALSFAVVQQPAKGTLVLQADGSFTYTPGAGATGTDSFTYRVTDAAGQVSATATVTIRFNTLNQDTDSALDAIDLGHFVNALGGSDAAFDLNGDGVVNDADLVIFLTEIKR